MAEPRVRITTPPGSATPLHTQNTREGDARCLASVSYADTVFRLVAGISGVDDIVAALEHPDRVLRINLQNVTHSAMERFSAILQVPFPELTYLEMSSTITSLPILPDAFLGGSILRLRYLSLERISLPSARGLLLSAGHLTFLSLWELPHSEYLSLDVMVACLPSLASLEHFALDSVSLNLAPIDQVCLRRHASLSLLSPAFPSVALGSTLKVSSPN
ncbi:hypothetical protein BC826DRAFT_485394 [Russula brevipes]|nr:hypothetical protein BC826DRAFT_485394 [Russula brevipes]